MIDPISTNISLGGDLVGCPPSPVVKLIAIGDLAEKKSLLTSPGMSRITQHPGLHHLCLGPTQQV